MILEITYTLHLYTTSHLDILSAMHLVSTETDLVLADERSREKAEESERRVNGTPV